MESDAEIVVLQPVVIIAKAGDVVFGGVKAFLSG
jgi:hypothetical protein